MPKDQPTTGDRGWLMVSAFIIIVLVWGYTRTPVAFSWDAEYGLVVIAGLFAAKAHNRAGHLTQSQSSAPRPRPQALQPGDSSSPTLDPGQPVQGPSIATPPGPDGVSRMPGTGSADLRWRIFGAVLQFVTVVVITHWLGGLSWWTAAVLAGVGVVMSQLFAQRSRNRGSCPGRRPSSRSPRPERHEGLDAALYTGPANLLARPAGSAERLLARLIRPGDPWNDTVARGGRVTVTAEDLIFRPHAINFRHDLLRIPLAEVTALEKQQHRSMRLLILGLADGSRVALVSWQRDRIIAAIEHTTTGHHTEPGRDQAWMV